MITLVHFNDTHLFAKNPVSRIDDANEELFAALDQVAQIAGHFRQQGDTVAVCHAGDWFNHESRVPWLVLLRLLDWVGDLRRQGIDLFTVPGNHDLRQDRYDSAGELPIGVLLRAGVVDVSRKVKAVHSPKAPPVLITGVPWPDSLNSLTPSTVSPEVNVVMVHGFGTPEGRERFGAYCHKYDDLAILASRVRIWHFGHDHSDHGVMRLKNGARVINIGALSRGSMDYDNLTRPVKIALSRWKDGGSTQEPDVLQVALKLPDVTKVFDLAARAKRQQEAKEIEAFVAQLAGGINDLLHVDYKSILAGLPLEDAVRAKVEGYIAQAETV